VHQLWTDLLGAEVDDPGADFFDLGGSSLTAANVRLLCAKHNLEKSDKILSVAPWIFTGAAAVTHIQKLSG
jgi:hypothetical protein